MELLPESPTPQTPAASVVAAAASDGRVPALKLWGIQRSLTFAILAALLVVIALIVVALWYAGFPSVTRDGTVSARTLFDLLKLVFAVVAGIGGVAALVVAYRRQRVAEHTNKLAEFAHELAHAADLRAEVSKALAEAADERAKIETDRNGVRLLNERFAKASEQLGSDKAAVRLAGVYAIAGLADDWKDGRQTCIDVLCAYLRMPYASPQESSGDGLTPVDDEVSEEMEQKARTAREEREVRHTLIRLIGRHLRSEAEDANSWRGYDFDFTGAFFDGGDFSGATFSGGEVSFDRATFGGGEVTFQGAAFTGARVTFHGAAFRGGKVSFYGATFGGGRVSFHAGTFSGGEMSFDRATFGGGEVSFYAAAFIGGRVTLHGAAFSGANVFFDGVTFSGGSVSFFGATFSRGHVSFHGATFSGTEVSFQQAIFDVPPTFDLWQSGEPPAGLRLPDQ
ncbi:pentapeptide repeat-containing protein [Micromonospora sp. NBC_01796]|uniref:pentapeptide repeat-containing protein n=1 Tax=Micromonospora sp. NBC_01796 TaxID=2975987 RepID=UPI002DDAED0A|nr:hypothetical protein [Micromonospora sp. NBC_01796]WSA87801.1 hypothetical protein OIE47_09455 [Micromonospora sp. NBC_01796]